MRTLFQNANDRFQLVLMGAVVGVGGGLAAVLLNRSLEELAEFFQPFWNRGYAFLLPALGAVLSTLCLTYLLKDVGGHGVPDVIYSVTRRGGLLRFRSSFSRLIACCLTIASGGSAGPEGPVVISGGSIGSNIASFFRLRDRQRVLLVGGGAAAAIASIFNAPVAGIAFSLEAILGEWTPTNLITIAVASAVGTEVSRLLQGNQIPFEGRIVGIGNLDVLACLGLVLFTSVGSVCFVRLLRGVRRVSGARIPWSWIRAGCGGLLVGLIGMVLPDVLGEGYGTIHRAIEGQYPPGLLIVGLLAAAKIVSTCLTIGTGGMGGIFAPCLVVGSFVGLFYGRILGVLFPTVHWAGEGYFALLGMAGVLSSVLQAPMTGIFLITEITGSYQVLVSVVLVSVMSVTLSHVFEPFSVYHQDLAEQGDLLRPRTDRRLLSELDIFELLETGCPRLHPEMRLREFVDIVREWGSRLFPVEDAKTGEYLGAVRADDVRSYLFNTHLYDTILVEQLIDSNTPAVSPDDALDEVMDIFEARHVSSLPVVHDRRFLGVISKTTILDRYRKELIVQEEI